MKIGRNQPCPCGSGKKYKRCCLDKQSNFKFKFDKHYFRIKGAEAESIVHELAIKSFLADWCYLNPKLPDGKEICDLLIVFDDIAIIWQVKSLKLGDDGYYKNKDIEKNFRQLAGAKRSLFEIDSELRLENPRRGKEVFNPKSIKHIYLISALMGPSQNTFDLIRELNYSIIHVFDQEFTEIVLNELDTISDFCNYIKARENLFLDRTIFLFGGEKELLAHYLNNNKTFLQYEKANAVFVDDGMWTHFTNRQEYKIKKEADEISYGWDELIGRAHETRNPDYERIARELARPGRFERRVLSKAFLDAWITATEDTENDMFRRIMESDGTTYVFLFFDVRLPRENRKKLLKAIGFFARGKFINNKRVIGIATEKELSKECSYDFFYLEKPDWTGEDQKEYKSIQDNLNLFKNPKISMVYEDEYPQK